MERDAILEELRRAAEELRSLADATRATPPDLTSALRAAEDVTREGAEIRPTVAIVGPDAARVRVVDALAGAKLLSSASSAAKGHARITLVRHSATPEFVAHSRDGRRVVRFSQIAPDRSELFDRRLEHARGERAKAVGELEQRREALAKAREKESEARKAAESSRAQGPDDTTRVLARPAELAPPPPWWALWLWIARLFAALFRRRPPALPDDGAGRRHERRQERKRIVDALGAEARAAHERVASLERELAGDDAVAKSEHTIERLGAERARYVQDRRDEILVHLARLGADVAELTIEYPAAHLPEGITLLDVSEPRGEDGRRFATAAVRRDALGFVVVEDPARPASPLLASFIEEIERAVPRLFTQPASTEGAAVAGHLRPILADAKRLAARATAMRLYACLPALRSARDDAEAAHARRLSTLEGQRLPDPAQFRARQVERVKAAIDEGVDAALKSADTLLRGDLGALRERWIESVAACENRRALVALAGELDPGIASGVSQVLQRTTALVDGELREVTQSIEMLALDEMRAHYPLARRLGSELLPPVAVDWSHAQNVAGTSPAPLGTAAAAFEKRRVTVGLGGAAVGAAIGTAILPGIGSAIGAVVGVFAGFLPRADALRKDCVARVEACVGDAEKRALELLAARRAELARGLHEALDAGLAGAFEQHEEAIARLQEVERRAIAAERETLAALQEARTTLARNELRLERIAAPAD